MPFGPLRLVDSDAGHPGYCAVTLPSLCVATEERVQGLEFAASGPAAQASS